NPVNLSLGQPDFAVPPEIQAAAVRAIRGGKNGYTPTPGIPELQEKLRVELRRRAGFTEGKVLITPGVSAALFMAMGVLVEKAYAMTGWRLGFAAGPAEIVDKMTVLQQFSFVCAPSTAQWAGVAALDVNVKEHRSDYRLKRDFVYDALKGLYDVEKPQGAFY